MVRSASLLDFRLKMAWQVLKISNGAWGQSCPVLSCPQLPCLRGSTEHTTSCAKLAFPYHRSSAFILYSGSTHPRLTLWMWAWVCLLTTSLAQRDYSQQTWPCLVSIRLFRTLIRPRYLSIFPRLLPLRLVPATSI